MQKKSFLYRSLFTSVLSFFISFSSYSQSLKDVNFGSNYSLDVISWNLEWFPKNGQNTIDSLAIIINSLNPEIIGLQEISDVSAFNSLMTQLPLYEGFYSGFSNLKLAYIYKKHNIDSLQFAESNTYYTFKSDAYKSIYEKLELKLTAQKTEYEALLEEKKRTKDSIRTSKQRKMDPLNRERQIEFESKMRPPLKKLDTLQKQPLK